MLNIRVKQVRFACFELMVCHLNGLLVQWCHEIFMLIHNYVIRSTCRIIEVSFWKRKKGKPLESEYS